MPMPAGTLTTDFVIQTRHAERRSRFYWISDTPPATANDVEHLANTVKTTFQAQLAALLPTIHSVMRVEARFYSGNLDLEAPSNTAATAGQIPIGSPTTTEPLPDEVALILRIQTGQLGRSRRGRRFICGLSEMLNDAGSVHSSMAVTCMNLATKVPQDITVAASANGYSTVLHARHYDRKNNALLPITKCWALKTLGTRRDRRKPLRLVPITTQP